MSGLGGKEQREGERKGEREKERVARDNAAGKINGDVRSTFLRTNVGSFHLPRAERNRFRGVRSRIEPILDRKSSSVKQEHLFYPAELNETLLLRFPFSLANVSTFS